MEEAARIAKAVRGDKGMENRPRKKLSRKMIGICSGFALILSVVLGSLGFYTYYHNIVDRYHQYIDTIIHICRSYIDADDMKECIDTGVKSKRRDGSYQIT